MSRNRYKIVTDPALRQIIAEKTEDGLNVSGRVQSQSMTPSAVSSPKPPKVKSWGFTQAVNPLFDPPVRNHPHDRRQDVEKRRQPTLKECA